MGTATTASSSSYYLADILIKMSTSLLGLALPKEYGYVLCATASTFFFGFWHGARVSGFRKNAGVPYPKVLAENSDMSAAEPDQKKAMYLFNCAQRAHGNYLENQPSVAIALLVAGFQYRVRSMLHKRGQVWRPGKADWSSILVRPAWALWPDSLDGRANAAVETAQGRLAACLAGQNATCLSCSLAKWRGLM